MPDWGFNIDYNSVTWKRGSVFFNRRFNTLMEAIVFKVFMDANEDELTEKYLRNYYLGL